jgi:hypothetical protein
MSTFSKEELEAGFTAILALWIREHCDANGGDEVRITRRSETELLYETGEQKMLISVRDISLDIANDEKMANIRRHLRSAT